MKEYKMITAKLEFAEQPNTVKGSVKSFFFPDDEQAKTDQIEKIMNQMSEEGWEVINVAPMPQPHHEMVLITFARERYM
ncbi:MAG: DUF4177 domain-containing protein [Oscillospiraceae bacterium]|jgi:hypothetical protein|nr:DUF4177 domain-containing protein [Oscillospiraceae bacterium]